MNHGDWGAYLAGLGVGAFIAATATGRLIRWLHHQAFVR